MPETDDAGTAAHTTGPQTATLRALLFDGTDPDHDLVRIVDTPERRVRHPSDILGMVISALAIALVLVLSVVAHGTTEGVTSDVQHGFAELLGRIFFFPVNVIDGIVTVVVPIAVLIDLGVRRLGRQVVESIAGAALGFMLGVVALLLVRHLGTPDFILGLSIIDTHGVARLEIPAYVSAVTALLTVAGPRTRRKTVRVSWNVLFTALVVVLIFNQVTLPVALLTLLLGRLAGQAVQYASGVRSERAYGPTLLHAIRRAGFQARALVRVRDLSSESGIDAATSTSSDPAAVALIRAGDNRVYAMVGADDVRRDVVVLDGDRQVLGFLERVWQGLRLRGLEGRAAISLKAVAERTALLSYAATAAGVRTPRLLGMGMAGDSAVLVLEHARGAVSLRDLPDDELDGERGDAVLAEAWEQLRRAHAAGLTHHRLTADVLLVHRDDDGDPHVWITGWEQGEIASSTLSRRLDLTQLLSLLALRVGARRAVASAVKALADDDIGAIGPLLQTIALPTDTREAMRHAKGLMNELRTAIVERLPEADVQPTRLTRFGARTVVMLALTIIVVVAAVTTFNFEQIQEAVLDANPWWVGASFALAGMTWFGAALTLVAFAPGRVPLFRATLAQMAGSFVALATPAGIGPAALNLRFLTRKGVTMPMAVATAALMQISQIVVTVVLLIAISLASGTGSLMHLPSSAVMLAVGIVAIVVVALLLVPGIRRWAWQKSRPTLQQVWPRLSQMLGQPTRLAAGLGGNVIMTAGYVLAFAAALEAFGQSVNIVDVAIVYLVGNTVGALVPTPGGLGGVEAALAGGLTTGAGVPAAIAVSVTFLFRFVSYWARVPIGWVAMRYLERKNDL